MQATVLFTPVIGDAIAAYEVGEFGTRAEERFAQNDILGGLGNRTLQTLAGLSLVPAVGIVGDVAGKGLKGLGINFRVDPNIPGGSVSGPKNPANEYTGTRPEKDGVQYKGLASPNIEALRSLKADKKYNLQDLVEELIRKNPNKVGELRGLGVISDTKPTPTGRGQIPILTTQVKKFFPDIDEVTPAGLELFMRPKLSSALEVRKSPAVINNSAGIRTPDSDEFLYLVDDVNMKNYSLDHTKDMRREGLLDAPDSVVAFSSIKSKPVSFEDAASGQRVVRNESILNAAQSDYVEMAAKAQAQRKDLGFSTTNPYNKPKLDITPEINDLVDDFKNLLSKRNKLVEKANNEEAFNLLFEDYKLVDGKVTKVGDTFALPKTRLTKDEQNFLDFTMSQSPSKRLQRNEIVSLGNKINDLELKLKTKLQASNPGLYNSGLLKTLNLNDVSYIDRGDMSEGLKRMYDRTLHYGQTNKNPIQNYSADMMEVDRDYYGSYGGKFTDVETQATNPKSVIPEDGLFLNKKVDLDALEDSIKNVNLDDSELVLKKDMYQKGNSSDYWKFVVRDKVNRQAQTTNDDVFVIPLDEIRSSGEIGGSSGSDSIRNIIKSYQNQGKELKKIAQELGLPPGSVREIDTNKIEPFRRLNPDFDPVVGPLGDLEGPLPLSQIKKLIQPAKLNRYEIDLDPVREALAEGKSIFNMKEGGPANLEDIEVLPVRFTRLLQAAESPGEAMVLGRSLGMQDREILEELDMIEFDSLYRPNMLYGDFRDLTLEELQALREREMEQGVIRGGDDIDSLLNKI